MGNGQGSTDVKSVKWKADGRTAETENGAEKKLDGNIGSEDNLWCTGAENFSVGETQVRNRML